MLVYLLVGRELLKQSGKERLPASSLRVAVKSVDGEPHMTEDALKKILKKPDARLGFDGS